MNRALLAQLWGFQRLSKAWLLPSEPGTRHHTLRFSMRSLSRAKRSNGTEMVYSRPRLSRQAHHRVAEKGAVQAHLQPCRAQALPNRLDAGGHEFNRALGIMHVAATVQHVEHLTGLADLLQFEKLKCWR